MADLQELIAASALIVKLEKIASSGCLSPEDEFDVRLLIVRAGKAFNLDSIAERPAPSDDPEYSVQLQLVSNEMERG